MRIQNTPATNARYWTAISIASVFGANLGDFVSHDLHMGHWRGLLPLALTLLVVLAAERRSKRATEAYYWTAIVIIRTAATNLADLGTHDFRLGYGGVTLVLVALLCGVVLIHGSGSVRGKTSGLPKTNGWYWLAMLVAGTLGTAAGDGVADALGLGVGLGSAVLSVALAIAFSLRTRAAFTVQAFYWVTIVLVRTTGTTVGDLTAHTLGLVPSTVVTGMVLSSMLALWQDRRQAVLGRHNQTAGLTNGGGGGSAAIKNTPKRW